MTIKTAMQILRIASQNDDTIIMRGKHGIGKSSIVKQLAKEQGWCLIELFLSHQETGDLIGIPTTVRNKIGEEEIFIRDADGNIVFDDNNNPKTIMEPIYEEITVWTKPSWLKRMEEAAAKGIPCILFLDELNRAPLDVRQAALQLVLERQIHEHMLPTVNGQRTFVVAAINPSDDDDVDYQVDELDTVLLDRFTEINIDVDVGAFVEYAKTQNANKIMIDFILENRSRLHFTPKDKKRGTSPRTWMKISDYMNAHAKEKFEEDLLYEIMEGRLGSEVATQFYKFYNEYANVVSMKDIENLIEEESKNTSVVEDIAEKLKDLTYNMDALQKDEMANALKEKYINNKNMLPLVAFLYSLELEIFTSFAHRLRKDERDNYDKIVAFDIALNGKELFDRVQRLNDPKIKELYYKNRAT